MTILDDIEKYKRQEIAAARARISDSRIEEHASAAPPTRGFRAALVAARAAGRYGLIAEIKKRVRRKV